MLIINVIKAIILGIVEGITEFLPISSTGHLYLANEFVKLNESKAFIDMFMVVIQLGAILAVVLLYFHKLNPFSPQKDKTEKQQTWTLWFKVIAAVLPSVIVGLPLNDWMDAHLNTWPVIAATLVIYGVLFILIERYNAKKNAVYTDLTTLPWRIALLIGVCQVLSLIPGTSRSGATILGAILLGSSRFVATEFSFFLAIPTMFGASLLKIWSFFKHGHYLTAPQGIVLLVGMLVSFIVAYLAIRYLLNYIKKNDFQAFGWYRIIIGLVVILYFGLLAR